eukprot:5973382-Amphidinium_carterae.1
MSVASVGALASFKRTHLPPCMTHPVSFSAPDVTQILNASTPARAIELQSTLAESCTDNALRNSKLFAKALNHMLWLRPVERLGFRDESLTLTVCVCHVQKDAMA